MTLSGNTNKYKGTGWSFDGLNLLRVGTNCSVTRARLRVRHDGIADTRAPRHLFVARHTLHA
jgi:hypothetical protein